MPICFRAPGVALRIEELLARVEPAHGSRALLRGERLRFARTLGVGVPWQPGSPVRDLRATAPPGAAFWLDGPAIGRPPLEGPELELELPELPWASGSVPIRGGSRFRFERREARGDRVRVGFVCEGEGAQHVLGWCAQAGAPALGDLAHGGSLALPGEPLFAADGALRVSAAAARALSRGHPWLTRDAESEDEGRFGAGRVVALRDPSGRALGTARIEGGPQLVARVWQREPDAGQAGARGAKPPSIEERALRALARREKLLASGETDALRLVHAEADALPGLFVDRFGPLLRVLVTSRAALPLWERASAVLARALDPSLGAEPSVVLALQLKPQPPGELACVQQTSGPPLPEPLWVREGGLTFRIDAGLAEPARAQPGVGLFPDQRRNRARLASRARGEGAYLNLFAHTGAFSAALLAAGAGSVTSVDLSAAYLARLEENLERSGLATTRHRCVKRDARRFLAELAADVQFDGIVLDPPTAAAAGREFWSARKGLEALAADCFRHLAKGGFLLVTSNDRRGRGKLRALVGAAAHAAGIAVALQAAPPSADYPPLPGFPEGDAFEGVLAERRG
jgi:23S rRNA (cytosine1962-C5)-methyltransferase